MRHATGWGYAWSCDKRLAAQFITVGPGGRGQGPEIDAEMRKNACQTDHSTL